MVKDSNDNYVAEGEDAPDIDSTLDDLLEEVVDRDRGLFTTSDREFLLGVKEYEYEQSAINKRRDIRDRLYSGLLDLQLLANVDPSERDKLFDSLDQAELHESISVLIAFVYSGLGGNIEAIEQMIRSGIYKAERGSIEGFGGGARDVEVNIDVTREYDVEEIYARFERNSGDNLTPAEIGVLVREGRLDPDDYEQLAWDSDERPRNAPAETSDQWYFDSETE